MSEQLMSVQTALWPAGWCRAVATQLANFSVHRSHAVCFGTRAVVDDEGSVSQRSRLPALLQTETLRNHIRIVHFFYLLSYF